MTYHPIQNIDIMENFVLHEWLTWSEHLIYNYAIKYKTKEDAIGYTRVFFSNSPTRQAYDRIVNHFKLLREYMQDWKIYLEPIVQFEKNIIKKSAKDWKGRPSKYVAPESQS